MTSSKSSADEFDLETNLGEVELPHIDVEELNQDLAKLDEQVSQLDVDPDIKADLQSMNSALRHISRGSVDEANKVLSELQTSLKARRGAGTIS